MDHYIVCMYRPARYADISPQVQFPQVKEGFTQLKYKIKQHPDSI